MDTGDQMGIILHRDRVSSTIILFWDMEILLFLLILAINYGVVGWMWSTVERWFSEGGESRW